jgi:predicted DNA-binding transcriptional regulator AlpA
MISSSVQAQDPPSAELLDVRGVAAMLGCSARHVIRLSDSGRMPQPIKLGALCRWKRKSISEWLENECRPVR